MSIKQGDIVRALKADPNGVNPKVRPFVILTRNEDIANGEPITAAAITGTLPNPLTAEYVELPWHANGQVKTGLRKRCAACCDWLDEIRPDEITERIGYLPGAKLKEIMLRIIQRDQTS